MRLATRDVHRQSARGRALARGTPRMLGALVFAATLALGSAFGAASACAQAGSASDRERYTRLIDEALSEFEHGAFLEARALFEQAHALAPSARTLRGLGMTSFELKHYVTARSELEAALNDTRKPLTKPQRKEVSALIERTQVYIGVIELTLVPPDASVFVDGNPASGHTLELDLGEYTLTLRAPGFRDAELRAVVEGGQTRQYSVELQPVDVSPQRAELPAPPKTPEPEPAAPAADTGSKSVLQSVWFWTAVGVLVAGGVTTAVLLSAHPAPKPLEDGDVGKVITTLRVAP